MTDTSTSQDVWRIRRYVVAALVFALLVYVGISVYNSFHKRKLTSISSETLIPTWNGVPTMIKGALKSARYEQGGKYLSNPSALKTDSSAQTAYAVRVIMDFLRSLSPDQVKIISKQPLKFSQLSKSQKDTLLLLTRLPGKANVTKRGPVDESDIFISSFPTKYNEGSLLFNWMIPISKAKPGLFDGVWMSITANGDKAFFRDQSRVK